MWQAYIGIVSQRGLEVFRLEDSDSLRFLPQRARPGHAGCFWTVLPDDVAVHIKQSLRRGQARTAWELVMREARDLGPLFASDAELADATDSCHHA
jgi:hypothetical protein